ncbi:MAG: hypothetical protein ACFFCV_00380 [Promethearchaeota archaeon]
MQNSIKPDLKSFIKNEIIKNAKKIKGKHAPISEIVDSTSKTLTIENIYDLRNKYRNYYFFSVKNFAKTPKLRYFLAITLANSSSDLLVQIARNIAIKNDLKLIQYSIFPKTFRIQLLLLKEIKEIKDFINLIERLKSYRTEYRNKLDKIRNIVENE